MPAGSAEPGANDGGGPTEIWRGGEVVHDGAALQTVAVQLQRERHQRKRLVREAGFDRDGEEAKPVEPKQQIDELVDESLTALVVINRGC